MTAPDLNAMAVALLWVHYSRDERDDLPLSEVQRQAEHVKACLEEARALIVEQQATWKTELPIPRLEELYREVWVAAARGKVEP